MSFEGQVPPFDPRPAFKTKEDPFKKVLITGCLGFIGRHLTKYLEERGYIVVGIDIEKGGVKEDLRTMDLNDNKYLECGHVIHLAAMAGVRQSMEPGEAVKYLENNVYATYRIFAHFHHRRVIYASSSNAYDPWRNIYALTKRACESMAAEHNRRDDNGHKIPGTEAHLGLRFTNVYGPGCSRDMLIPRILNGDLKYLSLNHARNFIHVEDVCSAIHTLMQDREVTGIMDIGTHKMTTLQELREKFKLDVPDKIVPLFEAPKIVPWVEDLRKLEDMGWTPKHDIIEYLESELKKRNN